MFGGLELVFGLLSTLKMVFFKGGWWGVQNTHIFDAIKSNTYCFQYVFVLYHHQHVFGGLCICLVC